MLAFLLTVCPGEGRDEVIYIFRKYYFDMMRYAGHRLHRVPGGRRGKRAAVEDIVQSALLKISRSISNVRFDRGEDAVKAYVFAVVSNEVKNYCRAQAEVPDMVEIGSCEDIPSDEDFFAALPMEEEENRVIAAIEKLDDKYRYTLMFRYTQEMGAPQIAELMGVSEKTVYTRLGRGKKLLLEQLRKDGVGNVRD